jgi:pyruvate carboxylase
MQPLDFKKIKAELRSKFGKHITDPDVTSYVMYPKVCRIIRRFARSVTNFIAIGVRGISRFR